jgi:hypothetical protein
MIRSGRAAATSLELTVRPSAPGDLDFLAEYVLAASDLDELRNPADAANHGLVPLLETNARSVGEIGCHRMRWTLLSEFLHKRSGLCRGPTRAPTVRIVA